MIEAEQGVSDRDVLAKAVRLIGSAPGTAERALRHIVQAQPDELNATVFLARALRAQRRPQDAISCLDGLIDVHPRFAAAHYERALALTEAGEKELAATALFAALDIDPNLPNGWLVLAENLFDRGDHTGADLAYGRHVSAAAGTDPVRGAIAALRDGNAAQARALLHTHLSRLPTDIAAIAVMGEVLGRLGESEKALALLRMCVERVPSFAAARYNCAIVLNQLRRPDEAAAHTQRLLQQEPDNAEYRTLHAALLAATGDISAAVEMFHGLVREFPDDAKRWSDYGQSLRGAGRQAEAVDAFRKSAALDSRNGTAYWGLANLKTVQLGSQDVDALRASLARVDLGSEDRKKFCFALGKALEDQGDFAGSFQAYLEGNTLHYAGQSHEGEADRRYLRGLQVFFSPETFTRFPEAGAPSGAPIFVVGLPRSGTTLVEQILDCHSAIEGVSELLDIGQIARRLEADAAAHGHETYPRMLARLDVKAMRILGEDYLARAHRHRKTAKPFFVDKMPGNYEHVGLIKLILPNAKIIDVRRHPLGCCVSNFKQLYANGQTWTYDLRALGRTYADYVALMAHFDAVLPGHVYRVVYENLVADPEGEVRRLLAWLGIEFEDGCLKFYENKRQVRTVSSEQVRKPIFADGVDHWKNFEPWLGPLKEALGPALVPPAQS